MFDSQVRRLLCLRQRNPIHQLVNPSQPAIVQPFIGTRVHQSLFLYEGIEIQRHECRNIFNTGMFFQLCRQVIRIAALRRLIRRFHHTSFEGCTGIPRIGLA